MADPSGAAVGLWQPGRWQGFSVLEEPGAPSWFELHSRSHAASVAWLVEVFGLETVVISDTDEFRYTTLRAGGTDVAGVMDAGQSLNDGEESQWSVYWEVEDVDAAVAKAVDLGGSVLHTPESTPYGRIAAVVDPAGAGFKLRTKD